MKKNAPIIIFCMMLLGTALGAWLAVTGRIFAPPPPPPEKVMELRYKDVTELNRASSGRLVWGLFVGKVYLLIPDKDIRKQTSHNPVLGAITAPFKRNGARMSGARFAPRGLEHMRVIDLEDAAKANSKAILYVLCDPPHAFDEHICNAAPEDRVQALQQRTRQLAQHLFYKQLRTGKAAAISVKGWEAKFYTEMTLHTQEHDGVMTEYVTIDSQRIVPVLCDGCFKK